MQPGRELPRMEQRSFLSFDGTPIGYQVGGNPEGVPLLFANGLGGTVSAYRFLIHRFSDVFRFYAWDYRGMYTSGRPLGGYDALTVEDHAKDGLSLLAHEGIERAFAVGWSMGVQVLLEMTRELGPRLLGLVLHNGVPGAPYKTLGGISALAPLVPFAVDSLQRVDGLVSRAVRFAVDSPWLLPVASRVGLAHHELDRDVFHDITGNFRQLDMHLYLEALRRLGEHDATDVLSRVAAPTLLIAATNDRLTPLSVAATMQERLPDGELKVIPGGTHYAAVEFPELVNRHLEDWLARRFPELQPLGKGRPTG